MQKKMKMYLAPAQSTTVLLFNICFSTSYIHLLFNVGRVLLFNLRRSEPQYQIQLPLELLNGLQTVSVRSTHQLG